MAGFNDNITFRLWNSNVNDLFKNKSNYFSSRFYECHSDETVALRELLLMERNAVLKWSIFSESFMRVKIARVIIIYVLNPINFPLEHLQ